MVTRRILAGVLLALASPFLFAATPSPTVTITNTGNTTWACGIVAGDGFKVLTQHTQQHTAIAACIDRAWDGLTYKVRDLTDLNVKATMGAAPPVVVPPPVVNKNCTLTWGPETSDMAPVQPDGKQTITYTQVATVKEPATGTGTCPDLTRTRVVVVQKPIPDPYTPAPAAVPYTTLRVQAATQATNPTDVGAFRLPCKYSHMAKDDPIVFPGQPGASHWHTFFGNASTDANSTDASLKAANAGTCAGGTANLSAYWMPSLVDTVTAKLLAPVDGGVYYKQYGLIPAAQHKAPPNGLRMIAGMSPANTTAPTGNIRHHFDCVRTSDRVQSPNTTYIPDCPAGSNLEMVVVFPSCWDGVNYDSPDHRSHMAYAGSKCPATHPVPIPEITLFFEYKVEPGAGRFKLASDAYAAAPWGYSMHADLWVNWNDAIEKTWFDSCIAAQRDCHSWLLGDGRALY